MRTVILVPRRADGGERDRLWDWCRQWWATEHPDVPIIEGYHEGGPFNRSAAVNRAAAGAWDVAVLIDADVLCDTGRVNEAVDLANLTRRVVLPFTVRYNLSYHGTQKVMAGERGSWKPFIHRTYHEMVSSCVVIPRSAWETVGGFDETFSGWGWEDTAWAAAVDTLVRPLLYIRGDLWHLWHATAQEGRVNSPTWRANKARAELYEAAWGDRTAMRGLLNESREAVAA